MIREFKNEYRWLSNFWLTPVRFNGVTYPSVEHAYMSAKSLRPEWKQFCANPENTPGKVKRKSKTIPLRKDWDEIKLGVMAECVFSKFELNRELAQKLVDTGDEVIVEENMWGDKFWGVCMKSGEGQNNLGRLIMKVRKYLINKNKN